MDSWPRSKISVPHESNDVVFFRNTGSSRGLKSSKEQHPAETRSSWLVKLVENRDHSVGNQRFLGLLRERLQEYKGKPPLERSLVALDILTKWRGEQTPPGRFLVIEDKTQPPLWNDVGDKKARSYISKALRYLSSGNRLSSEYQPQPGLSYQSQSATSDTWNTGADEMKNVEEERPDIPSIPKIESFHQAEKRISKQLNSVREDGNLYGHWRERNKLVEIFTRQKVRASKTRADFVIIKGSHGVGKTAFAHTLISPVVCSEKGAILERYKGPSLFLLRKFEQLDIVPNPTAILTTMIAKVCDQLEKQSDPDVLATYRETILDGMDEDTVALLIKLVPRMGKILGLSETNSISATSIQLPRIMGALAMQKMKSLVTSFFRSLASALPEERVVVLLDDLHWAGELPLDFLISMVEEVSSCGVLFVGTMRDDCAEGNYPHFLRAMLKLEMHENVDFHEICLGNLDRETVQYMLADTLKLDEAEVQSLCSFFYSLTEGNPALINEMLRNFQDEGLLCFHEASKQWVCDMQVVPHAFADINNVFDMFQKKALELPKRAQTTLMTAACLGSSELHVSILEVLDSSGTLASDLNLAVVSRLLEVKNERYMFVCDGCQNAIYAMIPSGDVASFHLNIGRQLSGYLDQRKDDDFLFIALRQLMKGGPLINSDIDCRAVALLCLRAGETAVKSMGFHTSWAFLSYGISLLSKQNLWSRECYDLSLHLYNAAIEVCYCNAEFEKLDDYVDLVLSHARSFEDTLQARSTQIIALGSRNLLNDAIESGLDTLKELGETFLSRIPPAVLRLAIKRTEKLLRRYSDEALLRIAPMTDEAKLSAMQILNHIYLYAFYSRPALSVLVIIRMIRLSLKHGICAMSPFAFAYYGMCICSHRHASEGYRYGVVARRLFEALKSEAWLCRTWTALYGGVLSWRVPRTISIENLRYSLRVGLRTGDIEYAMLSGSLLCWTSAATMPLPLLVKQAREIVGQMELSGHVLAQSMLNPLLQMARAMIEGNPIATQIELAKQESERCKANSGNLGVLYLTKALTMVVAYFLGDYETAEEYSDTSSHVYNAAYCGSGVAFVLFFECMTLCALAQKGRCRRRNVSYVKRRLKRLKDWALFCPGNFLDKQYLLQAELAVIENDQYTASSDYRSAILHARSGGVITMEALANERLGKYCIERGDLENGRPFMEEACRLYEKWGSGVKVRNFQEEYQTIFQSATM